MVKNPTATVDDSRDLGLMPGLDPMEEEMKTYSTILAWRIPCAEKLGGLLSMVSQRIQHDCTSEHSNEMWFILHLESAISE